jgi:hypothetical protein
MATRISVPAYSTQAFRNSTIVLILQVQGHLVVMHRSTVAARIRALVLQARANVVEAVSGTTGAGDPHQHRVAAAAEWANHHPPMMDESDLTVNEDRPD